jgi:6-methylsalicylate decarboxylase
MTASGRIDVHCHYLPDAYRAVLARHGQDAIAGTSVPDWSPELHEEFMRTWQIDTSVVSISDPGVRRDQASLAPVTE